MFIDLETASQTKIETETQPQQIILADGTRVKTEENTTLLIEIRNKKYTHTFKILNDLRSKVLIGVDLWGKTDITLKPPKDIKNDRTRYNRKTEQQVDTTEGLRPCNEKQEEILNKFLDRELRGFEDISGTTQFTQHHIRLKKNTIPINKDIDHETQPCSK